MNKIAIILGAAFALVAGTHASAQTLISGNFQGGNTVGLSSTDSTGAPGFVGTHWNNITGASGGPTVLNDSTGMASAITLTLFSAGPFGVDGTAMDNPNTTAQEKLFGGALNANYGSASFTLDGLSAFSTYSIVAYYSAGDDNFPQTRDAQIVLTDGLDSETDYVAGISSVYTDYTQSASTDPLTFESGNYVVFSGLSGDEQTLALNYVDGNLGLVGFQVLGTPAVVPPPATPEPSTWALMIGGLGLLIGLQNLRRRAS